jgi:hypothetical protein
MALSASGYFLHVLAAVTPFVYVFELNPMEVTLLDLKSAVAAADDLPINDLTIVRRACSIGSSLGSNDNTNSSRAKGV